MKRKIVLVICFLCLCQIVLADVDVGIGINSGGGDIDAWVDLESEGGDIDLWIDGINFENSLDNVYTTIASSHRRMSSIYWQMSSIFMTKNTLTRQWGITDYSDLEASEANLRLVLENYFLNTVMKKYENRIRTLEFEIMALQNLHDKEELCKAKIEVAKEYDLDSVKCNGHTYLISGDNAIVLSDLPKTIEEIDEEEWQKELLDYKRLEEAQEKRDRMLNNTQSYIDIICPEGDWTDGKCIGGDKE